MIVEIVDFRFTTIKNYTALKRSVSDGVFLLCFTTIKNCTTLKLLMAAAIAFGGFTTIKNYTTLKQMSMVRLVPLRVVLLPLRITQLSNNKSIIFFGSDYSLAHKFRKCKGLCL